MNHNGNNIEARLWEAADELRANSKLKSSEYSVPVLGLVFLRFADHKFQVAAKELTGQGGGRRKIGPSDYQAKGVLYLPEAARFSALIQLPEGDNIGEAINDAMRAIEAENPDLKDVLPKTYNRFENTLLKELLKTMNSVPMDIEGDAFGKIYEYFLGNFARAEGQKGGEFFTPIAIVRLIVGIIEPFHGRIFDPACGSGGMFVQSARFVTEHQKNPGAELSVYGQEKVAETVRLGKMNLAVHGLAGDIRQGNAYYEDLHRSTGKFDFVMANPPFNVDRVDKDRLKDDPRFPFGLPREDNANYLWIQLFCSALNTQGRAGFVMHNSAVDAELQLRRELVEQNVVDVVLITSPNLFYTVNLPASLWFLDKGRGDTSRKGHILFIDARRYFEPVDTAHRTMTDKQINEICSIVRKYRGQQGLPSYEDIPGICYRATIDEVRQNNYTLNPKVYIEPATVANHCIKIAADLSETYDEVQNEVERLSRSLSKRLSVTPPLDRGVLFNFAKILFKRWLVHFDTPGIQRGAGSDELPEGWTRMPFRGAISHYIGGGWGEEQPDLRHTERVRIIRGTDIPGANAGRLDDCPVRYITASQLASRRLKVGDIVFEVSGGGKERSTGRTAFLTDALLASSSEPVIPASFCKLVRVDANVTVDSLSFLWLQHLYEEEIMGRYEVQSTGIKNFKFELFLDKCEIVVPPEELRRYLGSILEDIFQLTHLLGRIDQISWLALSALPPFDPSLFGLSALQYVVQAIDSSEISGE